MTGWTADELEKIATTDELEIASLRSDGTLGSKRTIWVVRVDDDLYVRSVNGRTSDWFRGTQRRHEGRIRAGGVEKDVTFVEAPTSLEQIADIPRRLPWPQVINIVLGGKTPELPNERLKELGYAGVIYANVALQAAVKGMQAALGELRRKGYMGDAATSMVADFSERQRLVHKDEFDALERKYVEKR